MPRRENPLSARLVACVAVALAALWTMGPARADPRAAPPPVRASPAERPWSDVDPRIAADVRNGKPLVTLIMVPLCSNEQVDCGSGAAGRPGDLETNLYWGAAFGQRRFFERKKSGWARVELTRQGGALLERAVYRRITSRAPWGGAPGETVEQIVVLQAVHGAAIDRAVALFHGIATQGGAIQFLDGAARRVERVHVAGYAGHNRLMDGLKLSPARERPTSAAPIPSFVMACASDAYFSDDLRRAGSEPIVMTRSLMAPEGYVIDAIARALGDNAPRSQVRARAVEAYARWQRISTAAAGTVFSR